MKKSLFAVAAATAFAGAAQAQSSVTVYGIMDVGYTNGSAKNSTTGGVITKQNVSRIGNSMESGSRLGFRGTEDLGGGTSAQFVFELGLQPAGNAGSNPAGTNPANATVATASDSVNAGSPNWTPNVRQAFVGITQKGIGILRIGTQNTFNWEQAGSNTVGELNQTVGSMLAPTTDGAYFSSDTRSGTLSAVTNPSMVGAFTNRTTNTITFRTERMAGVQAKLGAVLSNQNNTQLAQSGGNFNQYGWMGALDANIQKANIQASYQVFTSEINPLSTTTGVTTVPAAWGSGVQGNNIVDSQALVTASYNFGILKAYAGWTNRKLQNSSDATRFAKRTAQEIGVRGYATKQVEAWASVGNGKWTAYGQNSPSANMVGWQAGTNYWMSKRTNLYAIYGQNQTSATSANGTASISQASVGIRHTF